MLDSNQFYTNYTHQLHIPGSGMAIRAQSFDENYGKLILINNMICNNGYGTTNDAQADALLIFDVLNSYISNNTIANNDAGNGSAVIIKAKSRR